MLQKILKLYNEKAAMSHRFYDRIVIKMRHEFHNDNARKYTRGRYISFFLGHVME